MSKWINAGALSKDLQKRWNVSDDHDFADKEVWRALNEAPSIDIVRCNECKYWNSVAYECRVHAGITLWAERDFCSYGERRE